jgi:catechol 2,3-dioxygenase-like lactoylglutathione lyase family enzyme
MSIFMRLSWFAYRQADGRIEDAGQLHLFYGDALGSPGSLVTFLVWENGSPGRVGHGQVSEIAFAIAPESIGFWLTRALSFGLQAEGPLKQLGEPVLRLRDPDGISVKLVGAKLPATAPWAVTDIPAAYRQTRPWGDHPVRRALADRRFHTTPFRLPPSFGERRNNPARFGCRRRRRCSRRLGFLARPGRHRKRRPYRLPCTGCQTDRISRGRTDASQFDCDDHP